VNRRDFLIAASSSLTAAFASPSNSAEPLKELRIGYQKIGALLMVKEQKVLEQRFEPQGVRVRWIEFAFGPPLLEALGAGAIDYGYTGDSPPIFAQAAHANLLYAGAIPARGYGQAILVPAASSIEGISGLKGKKIAGQGVERPQPPGRRARKRRSPVARHNAGVSRASRRRRRLRPGRSRRLVYLGSIPRYR
jgi:sulfonate transport system substrate-binding protein